MSAGDGTKAALIDAARDAAAEVAASEGEQLQLLPPTRFEPGDEFGHHEKMVAAVKRDQAGRPKGAQNKATREVKTLCRRLFGDPMLERFRWAMHTPDTLARELGCSKLEAFDRLDRIRSELALFFYARMAPTDEAGNVAPAVFQMFMGGAAAPGGPQTPPWSYLEGQAKPVQESQQNQALPQSDAAISHAAISHEDGK